MLAAEHWPEIEMSSEARTTRGRLLAHQEHTEYINMR